MPTPIVFRVDALNQFTHGVVHKLSGGHASGRHLGLQPSRIGVLHRGGVVGIDHSGGETFV